MSAMDIFGFGRAASAASESRWAMVGDMWGAESGVGETSVGWPSSGVVGVAEVKGGDWERASSGVGNPPRPTVRTRCKIFVPAFES